MVKQPVSGTVEHDALGAIGHPKKRRFLLMFAESFSVVRAARTAWIHRSVHYFWLNIDPDYARAFVASKRQALDVLESEAHALALGEHEEYVLHAGQPVRDLETGEWIKRRVRSPFLHWKLLQAAAPEKYRENHVPVVEGDGVRVAGRSREEVIQEQIEARQAALEQLRASRASVMNGPCD